MCTFHTNELDNIFNFGSEILQLLWCFGGNQIEMGEMGSAAVIILCLFPLQPLFRIWSSAISDLKETSRKPSLFCSNGFNWTRSLKEADANPRRSECPAYFNIWLFDISTIVLIIFTTIVCIFTSVFNAMRQLLGQSHCPGLPMGLPIHQINCSLARSIPFAQMLNNLAREMSLQRSQLNWPKSFITLHITQSNGAPHPPN